MVTIIDEYQTPDNRYEYRLKHNGEVFPPMSFTEPQSLYKLGKVIDNILASREQVEEVV
jgi:hypothetical protein